MKRSEGNRPQFSSDKSQVVANQTSKIQNSDRKSPPDKKWTSHEEQFLQNSNSQMKNKQSSRYDNRSSHHSSYVSGSEYDEDDDEGDHQSTYNYNNQEDHYRINNNNNNNQYKNQPTTRRSQPLPNNRPQSSTKVNRSNNNNNNNMQMTSESFEPLTFEEITKHFFHRCVLSSTGMKPDDVEQLTNTLNGLLGNGNNNNNVKRNGNVSSSSSPHFRKANTNFASYKNNNNSENDNVPVSSIDTCFGGQAFEQMSQMISNGVAETCYSMIQNLPSWLTYINNSTPSSLSEHDDIPSSQTQEPSRQNSGDNSTNGNNKRVTIELDQDDRKTT